MRFLWIVLLLAACSFGNAQAPSTTTIRDFPAYVIYPGTLDEDDFPTSSSRLCTTEANPHCYTLPRTSYDSDNTNFSYYALRTKSKRFKLDSGGSLILFNANCGGGSGSADRYALLRSEPSQHLKDLLPEIIVSNQADVAMWNIPDASPLPVFVVADFLWGAGEAHYSSHFFEVRIYAYDSKADRYTFRHKYRTAHKYPGIDNWEQAPGVLASERNRVVKFMSSK